MEGWQYGNIDSLAEILFEPAAREVYLDLDRRCAEQYPSALDARYVGDEVRRIVFAIATDPTQRWLQGHRIPDADLNLTYVVVVRTATGVDCDAAVFWTFRRS